MQNSPLSDLRTLFKSSSFALLALRGRLDKVANVAKTDTALKTTRIQALLVDSADAHQSEYVANDSKQRAYLTNFTGSNGTALVTLDKALLWTDGRYFLQAEQELCDSWTLMRSQEPNVPTLPEWIRKNLAASQGCLAIDPLLTSVAAARKLLSDLEDSDIEVAALANSINLVDLVWKNKPARRPSKVMLLDQRYTGRSVAEKLAELRQELEKNEAHAMILTALDDIAWLFNIRGNDIEFNPLVISYALVDQSSATIYADVENQNQVEEQLNGLVKLRPYDSMMEGLQSYISLHPGKHILVDPIQCNVAVFLSIPPKMRREKRSPVMSSKAIKNPTEIEGMKLAHLHDGAALVKFFSWLEREMQHKSQLDEVQVADRQEAFRKENCDFVSLSFDTISAMSANAAIIHYKPKRGSCSKLTCDGVYLNDSGAQYLSGTTDVTRTLHFGIPTEYEKKCFTLVLKAHIAFASAIFPNKTDGVKLDALARAPLWRYGLDYRHGTAHGVGAFLNVHEKGVLASIHANSSNLPIQEGMIISNEPGYYENGAFGIRIENIVVVKKASTLAGKDAFCELETITMVPFSRILIDASLLTECERQWVNAYHAVVREKLAPLLVAHQDALTYLNRETSLL